MFFLVISVNNNPDVLTVLPCRKLGVGAGQFSGKTFMTLTGRKERLGLWEAPGMGAVMRGRGSRLNFPGS